MLDSVLKRRKVLGGAVGAAALGTLGSQALAGCSSNTAENSNTANSSVELPTYIPYDGVKPDLPATKEGTQPAFFAYPAEPQDFMSDKPANGGTVTSLCIVNTPPKELSKNRYWQEINKELGTELQIAGAPTESYIARFQTVIAGNELPDLMQVYPTIPDVPNLLEAKFENLSEHLSGDHIKNYPALANIPTSTWKSAVYNGGIYGVPLHRTPVRYWAAVRGDLIDDAGVPAQPNSGDELREMFKALTDSKANQWACHAPINTVNFVNQMLGAPNNWAVEGGKFTKDYESEEMKQSIDFVAQMWKAGYFHPDSFATTNARTVSWLSSGTTKVLIGAATWQTTALAVKKDNPAHFLAPFLPPKFSGGGMAKSYLGSGFLTITALKKASKERVQELLRVINWLAAPFGTAEHRLRAYGVKDWDYTLSGSDPVTTDTGKAESMVAVQYLGACPVAHYAPGNPDIAKLEYETEQAALSDGIPWPTAGLYSPTDQSRSGALDKTMIALQTDIITGRKPLSAWDDGVRTWKTQAGDTIRREYQEALQNQED